MKENPASRGGRPDPILRPDFSGYHAAMIDLNSLPLLARGGQADIYDMGDGRILRVPRRPQDYERIRYEYQVYLSLSGSGIAAPRVYGIEDVGGAPSIVMERIIGASMMDRIRGNPFSLGSEARELARMHMEILGANGTSPLMKNKDKARYCILASEFFTEAEKELLFKLLAGLPDGTAFCHGDFHPGNIIYRDGRSFVIDWSAASVGDFVSDVAHTYVLLTGVPRLPGVSAPMHFMQKVLGNLIAHAYLDAVSRLRPFDGEILTKWIVIKSAERTYYGLPSEKDGLAAFVRARLK
jgi:hypothetical protein